MSQRGHGLLGLFVEPAGGANRSSRRLGSGAESGGPGTSQPYSAGLAASQPGRSRTADGQSAPVWARPARGSRHRRAPQGWSRMGEPARPPALAVLASSARVVGATAAVAAALVRVHRARCAVTGVLGATAPSAGSALTPPASRRAAAEVRRGGRHAVAAGRLVWLADDVVRVDASAADPRAVSFDADVDLAGEARRLGLPAVLGVALSRTAELDRTLARQDAIVVVREPGADEELTELVFASLARLDRPIVAMRPLGRLAAALATTGQYAPAAGVQVARGLVGAQQ